jgi:hypothetical protein
MGRNSPTRVYGRPSVSTPASVVVLAFVAAAVGLAWGYFRVFAVTRPPIGVVTRGDILVLLAVTVVAPYLYLALPIWLFAVFFGLLLLCIIAITLEPVFHRHWIAWMVSLILVATNGGVVLAVGPTSVLHLVVNNCIIVVAAIGLANLWPQSGMKARDLALLVCGLIVYDVVFTVHLETMNDLMSRLDDFPFSPQLVWPIGQDGNWLGLGFGDLLFTSTFPLVMRKAFGRLSGLLGMASVLVALAAMLGIAEFGGSPVAFPAMAVLGPVMVAQIVYWNRARGSERTTHQYLTAEPTVSHARAIRHESVTTAET